MNVLKHVFSVAAVGLTFALLGLLATGCKTDVRPESAQFASVIIAGKSLNQIHSTTIEVFHEHDYKAVTNTVSTMVFERMASKATNLVYGNWLGGRVWNRVKLALVPAGENGFRIECHAFLVENKGEVLEEEKPVGHSHHAQYQEMLDEVAKRLN